MSYLLNSQIRYADNYQLWIKAEVTDTLKCRLRFLHPLSMPHGGDPVNSFQVLPNLTQLQSLIRNVCFLGATIPVAFPGCFL